MSEWFDRIATPRPWQRSAVRTRVAGMPVISIGEPDKPHVVLVLYGRGEEQAVAEADAALIVAAVNARNGAAHTTARPLDTSGKPPIAARGDSEQSNGVHEGATPSATTDAMERAREVVDSMTVDFGIDKTSPAGRWRSHITAAITSAVEQERQVIITRDLGCGKFVINYGYFGDKAALFIEPAPVPGTVGASAGSSGLNKTECVAGGIVITFANSASAAVLRDQIEMASHLIESSRSRSAETPKPEPLTYECMMDGNCRRDFAQCEKAGKCLSAWPPDTEGGE